MVIYANQTLRASYVAMSKLLKQIHAAESINQINQEISSMEEIFDLQEMYSIKKQEIDIEENLKKLGYIDE